MIRPTSSGGIAQPPVRCSILVAGPWHTSHCPLAFAQGNTGREGVAIIDAYRNRSPRLIQSQQPERRTRYTGSVIVKWKETTHETIWRYILAPRQRLRSGRRPTSTRGKEREKAGMDGWMTWVRENEASIVELGSPLGKTKRMNAKGISDTQNEMTAYTIVQAESHEAAAELFASHPHFMIFPGDLVEIMECLPIPRM